MDHGADAIVGLKNNEPRVEYRKTYVRLPRGRVFQVPDGHIQYDEAGNPMSGIGYVKGPDSQLVGNRTVPFIQTEETTRPGPNASLGPSSRYISSKLYKNEYVFRADEKSRFFADDFATSVDENGETVYINKARRDLTVKFAEAKLDEELKKVEEDEVRRTGETISIKPHYYDSYSGQRLVEFRGNLCTKQEAKENKLYKSDWQEAFEEIGEIWDNDNFRIRWPWADPNRNKMISTSAYEWFDRTNPYIERDSDFQFEELDGTYMDPLRRQKWRTRGGDDPMDFALDIMDEVLP